MQLSSVRYIFTQKSTIGKLFVDDVFLCYIMEPEDCGLTDLMTLEQIQAIKSARLAQGKRTAIPTGTYLLRMVSGAGIYDRFTPPLPYTKDDFVVPELQNIKDYTQVLFHPGSKPSMTEACQLTGSEIAGSDLLSGSWQAFIKLDEKCFGNISTGAVAYSIGRDPEAWEKWQLINNSNNN